MLQDQPLALGAARYLQANIVLLICPVDANEGGVDLAFTLVHVFTSRTVGGRDMRSQLGTLARPPISLSLAKTCTATCP
jgi:hypothetical protein